MLYVLSTIFHGNIVNFENFEKHFAVLAAPAALLVTKINHAFIAVKLNFSDTPRAAGGGERSQGLILSFGKSVQPEKYHIFDAD